MTGFRQYQGRGLEHGLGMTTTNSDFKPTAPRRIDSRLTDQNVIDREDEDSDFDEDDNEEQLKDHLNDALSDIRDCKVSFKPEDSQSLDSFTQKYEKIFQPPEYGPNALHLLVTETNLPKLEPNSLGQFVTYLVKYDDRLLEQRDGDGEGCTPLMRAISAKKTKDRRDERMVEWMIRAHPEIDRILRISDGKKQNCIHAAVLKRRRQYLPVLIKKASSTTLAAKDSLGNTPLHYAVHFDSCRGQKWLGIIEDLAKKSEEAVANSVGGDLNHDGLSPYLFHIKTRKQKTTSGDKDRNKIKADSRIPHNQQFPQGKADFRALSSHPRVHPESLPLTPDMVPRPNRPSKTDVQSRLRTHEALRLNNSTGLAVLGSPSFLPPDGPQQNEWTMLTTPASDHRAAGYKKSTKDREISRVDEDISSSVEQFLKLHYLRNRKDLDCRTILYNDELTPGMVP